MTTTTPSTTPDGPGGSTGSTTSEGPGRSTRSTTSDAAGRSGEFTGSTGTGARAGFGHLMASEWAKIRSVRSTVWSLIVMIVLTVGFTVLMAAITVMNWATASAARKWQMVGDPLTLLVQPGVSSGRLAVCVLGVMVIAGEYSTGSIRSSLLAVPGRTPMLAAKAAVLGLLVFVVTELIVLPSFLIGAAILGERVDVSLADPEVLRAVTGAGLYLALQALFALAVGTLLRHTAAAITCVLALVLVVPNLLVMLPGEVGRAVYSFFPTVAGQAILVGDAQQAASPAPLASLSPWAGIAVLALWTAALLALAAHLLRRRDA
ncbi:ABC transporter permease [Streptosporangium sp. DT93]|uniref:ABC transporter permease subunit n=1 Tax=Streptosporangium sp. DT93 TaxID=3393428 RepID=UPI003CF38619